VTVTILDDSMSSDRTPHTARRTPADWRTWEVSWLSGRSVDRNSAITAMALADLAASDDVHAGHRLWPHVSAWAAELELTPSEALTQLANAPQWAVADWSGARGDPEAGG
jgi:hypothetical protein